MITNKLVTGIGEVYRPAARMDKLHIHILSNFATLPSSWKEGKLIKIKNEINRLKPRTAEKIVRLPLLNLFFDGAAKKRTEEH